MSAVPKVSRAAVRTDTCAGAMDAFLLKGVAAFNVSSVTPAPLPMAAYVLGCAVIYAATAIARAIDRHSARNNPMQKTDRKDDPQPNKTTTVPAPCGRDPALLRIEEESGRATPMPKALRERAAQLRAQLGGAGVPHRRKP